MSRVIQKILIANRGEIACRVMRTCKRLGIQTVAVYSDADKNSLHVEMADEAVYIGSAQATESYLVPSKVLDAAKLTSADAIHPGYGFLSENPDFAEACANAGVIFIGPSAESMNAMALKGQAKALMEEAGVPVVPGYHGADQSDSALIKASETIGFPLLVKAVAGGGGKGMRAVMTAKDLSAALKAARSEAKNAFGNDVLILEKLITKPRHIEVQVFGDTHGNTVHLFERDCSIQRRHQKVVEEAPAPGMTPELRAKMCEAAVKAAAAIDYTGAGTIEFIVDVTNGLADAPFYFMEMNTRLQVEHPVTEMITGTDLVEWQIRVAQGERLPLSQSEIEQSFAGHAVEVRLYAEDPLSGFLPSSGKLDLFDTTGATERHTRVETGVRSGDEISIYYDPMIAKLVAWGENRETAIQTLTGLLAKTAIVGVKNNRDILQTILNNQDFADGSLDTGFIANHERDLLIAPEQTEADCALAAAAILAKRPKKTGPWSNDAFRLGLPAVEQIYLTDENGEKYKVSVTHGPKIVINTLSNSYYFNNLMIDDSNFTYTLNGLKQSIKLHVSDTVITLFHSDRTITVPLYRDQALTGQNVGQAGAINAPMPGKILSVQASNGDAVEKGQPILILEAMKMEHTITAPCPGTLDGLTALAGNQVKGGEALFHIIDPQ